MLAPNVLLEWPTLPTGGAQSLEQAEPRIDRVLFIDNARVVLIDIFAKDALPRIEDRTAIEAALNDRHVQISQDDPYDTLRQLEQLIKAKHRQKRDKIWKIIQPLVENEDGQPNFDIFMEETRGKLISAASKITNYSKPLFYRDLRRFWQGGQFKNTLLPHWNKSGGKGKRKGAGEKKRGRPNIIQVVTGQPDGVNVNEDALEKILLGFKLYYEKRNRPTLKDAYYRTLQKFFFTNQIIKDGVLTPILPPAGELPTYEQCLYWYKKNQGLEKMLKKRHGERAFNLTFRATLGNATNLAFGPTSVYQADAGYSPVPLVSSSDPTRIIGFPIIYLVVDVFSRFIVGIAVTLDNVPKWAGAMAALINATKDKKDFCEKHGIQIESWEWPGQFIPSKLHADRGEFEGIDADTLPNALGIEITNTPPYRPDFKPIVEQAIGEIKRRLRLLPGATDKYKGQGRLGELDSRLYATLTYPEFVKILIHIVLELNNERRIKGYPRTEDMIKEGAEPYPLELWNWGLPNLIGVPRTQPDEVIRQSLFPIRQGSITSGGILYNELYYTCELAEKEGWYVRARYKGREKVNISIDPHWIGTIYLHVNGQAQLVPCQLTDKHKAFTEWAWEEYNDYLTNEKIQRREAETRRNQARAHSDAQIDAVVIPAKKRGRIAVKNDPKSNSARLRDVANNRKEERLAENNISHHGGTTGTDPKIEPAAKSLPENNVNYVPKPSNIEKFRRQNILNQPANEAQNEGPQ